MGYSVSRIGAQSLRSAISQAVFWGVGILLIRSEQFDNLFLRVGEVCRLKPYGVHLKPQTEPHSLLHAECLFP